MDLVKRGVDLEYDISRLLECLRNDEQGEMRKLKFQDIDDILSICYASKANFDLIIEFLNKRKKYMEEMGYLPKEQGPQKTINHYGVTVDLSRPTTGVFQNNHCEWLYDDVDRDGCQVEWYAHLEECKEEEHDFCYESDGSQTDLIGFMKTEEQEKAWYWFPNQKFGFLPDSDAEYSAIVGEIYTQVVRSQWGIKCAFCSPCYPGQGDADTPGDILCYSLPPEVIGYEDAEGAEEERRLKGRIFKLEE